MKKLLSLMLVMFAFVACEKEPDTDKIEKDVIVITDYQKGTSFSSYHDFYIPDSILEINEITDDTIYISNADALSAINKIATNMTTLGYTEVEEKSDADLGIQVSYIKSRYYLTTIGAPWRYHGYWWPGYWGPEWRGYGWYYPYRITYSYTVGSLIIDMVNLNGTVTNNNVPIVWNAYISGLLTGNNEINMAKATSGINQAFTQSSYLKISSN
jgi:hypothetical protein